MSEQMKMQSEWIKQLRKENEALKKQIRDLEEERDGLKDMIDDLKQQIYSMREDLAGATYNLGRLIDFPNSTDHKSENAPVDKFY